MNFSKGAGIIALSALVSAGGIGGADAASIFVTGWYSATNGDPTPRNLTLTDWNNGSQTISVAQFDDMGGSRVLDQVKLTFFGDIDSTGNITAGATDISVS